MYTTEQLETKLKEAQKRYNKHKLNSQRIRDTHLDRLAEAHTRDSDVSKATMYRQLKQRENTRQSHRNIKYVTKQIEKTGMTKVVVITEDGPKELTEKQDIENTCLAENEDKYHQTENTPCMQQPLRDLLGPYCTGYSVWKLHTSTKYMPLRPRTLLRITKSRNRPSRMPQSTHLKRRLYQRLEENKITNISKPGHPFWPHESMLPRHVLGTSGICISKHTLLIRILSQKMEDSSRRHDQEKDQFRICQRPTHPSALRLQLQLQQQELGTNSNAPCNQTQPDSPRTV